MLGLDFKNMTNFLWPLNSPFKFHFAFVSHSQIFHFQTQKKSYFYNLSDNCRKTDAYRIQKCVAFLGHFLGLCSGSCKLGKLQSSGPVYMTSPVGPLTLLIIRWRWQSRHRLCCLNRRGPSARSSCSSSPRERSSRWCRGQEEKEGAE